MTGLPVKTRDEWRDYWLRSYKSRNPDSDVGPGSYPWIRACVFADSMTIMSDAALKLSDAIPLDNCVGEQLDAKYGSRIPRNLESRGFGRVVVKCGGAGTILYNGDKLTNTDTGNKYRIILSNPVQLLMNGQTVEVESIDNGPEQNLGAGAPLLWYSPRAGCFATAFVDPDGITGGSPRDSDDQYRERIRVYNSNPVGHANNGDVLALIQKTSEHGVAVEAPFVYPAFNGPGSLAISFTKKAEYWESRIPSLSDFTRVHKYVCDNLPAHFSIISYIPHYLNTELDLRVTLEATKNGTLSTWPQYAPRLSGMVVVESASSAFSFKLRTDNDVYTGVRQPSPGMVIGVFDSNRCRMLRKTIATVTGTGPWDITCRPENNYSDSTFTPSVGKAVSNWFDDQDKLSEVAGRYCAGLGPGEMFYPLPTDGMRKARQPVPRLGQWDDKLTEHVGPHIQSKISWVTTCVVLGISQRVALIAEAGRTYILKLNDLAIFG